MQLYIASIYARACQLYNGMEQMMSELLIDNKKLSKYVYIYTNQYNQCLHIEVVMNATPTVNR